MERENTKKAKILHYMVILTAFWTAVVSISLVFSLSQIKKYMLLEMRNQARAIYGKDIFYRRWNASHGGVYVPVTEKSKPNPYLSHVPNRDITTTDGQKFTLINPAYMTRQIHELMDEQKDGIRGHTTSLKLLNPINKPDPWESKALEAFENGETEVSSLEKMEDGNTYMRLMSPMITEKQCLKCHAIQGYKVGDVRGGVSVSIPIGSRFAVMQREKFSIIFGHSFMWLLGLGVIIFGGLKQKRANRELESFNQQLTANEQQLKASSQQLQASEQQLRAEIDERKKMEEALRKSEMIFRTTITGLPHAVFALNHESMFIVSEGQGLEKLDILPDRVLGKSAHEVFVDRPIILEVIQRALEGQGSESNIEIGELALHIQCSPILNPNGKVEGIIGVSTDITERKRMEEEKEKHLHDLEVFYKASFGREGRIVELKKRVKELEEKLAKRTGA